MAPDKSDSKVPLVLDNMLGVVPESNQVPQSQADNDDGTQDGSGKKKVFLPYHSQSVPKSEKLVPTDQTKPGGRRPVTTMMLRNIPNKYTQASLLQEIDGQGFEGTYNFFYLPMDVHNRSNVGYAFINLIRPADAERFRRIFGEHRFQKYQSRKVSSVCSAHVQGLDENLRHLENRAVTHARNDQYRPIVFKGNVRVDFEDALAQAKSRLTCKTSENDANGKGQRRSTGQRHGSESAARTVQPKRQTAPPSPPVARTPTPVTSPSMRATLGPDHLQDKSLLGVPSLLGMESPQNPNFLPALQQLLSSAKNMDVLGQEVAQLLLLKNMLLNRLQQPGFPPGMGVPAPTPKDSPAYVPLPVHSAYGRCSAVVNGLQQGVPFPVGGAEVFRH